MKRSKKAGTIDVAKHTRPRTAPKADPFAEFKDEDGVINAVDHANSMRMIRVSGGDARKAAVAAVAGPPRRQQTLDDFEFSLDSKQTMQGALNELSADEIDAMIKAMDSGPGVDVRSGRNKMAFDTMRMKRGMEAGGSVDETGALSFDYGKVGGGPMRSLLGGSYGRSLSSMMRLPEEEEEVGTVS